MATRQAGGRRRLDASIPEEYDVPTRAPRIASPEIARLVMTGITTLWLVGTIGASTAVIAVDVPHWIARPSAALLLVVFTVGLVHRSGGLMRLWAPLAGILAVAALVSERQGLLASAALLTGVLSAVWAVMVTRPAASLVAVLREFGIALLAAISGAIGVAAWNVEVDSQRFALVLMAASLAIVIALVWSLGAGLHGLGKQGFLILVGIATLLLIVLLYSSFVRTHGSQSLINAITDLTIWMRETIRGVPRPVEVFVGFPALIVGVSMRSRRREGWWVLVFAVVGTAAVTASLVSPGAFPSYIGFSTLYSIVLGGIVGLVVRSRVMVERSARAARQFEEERRVEPGRFAPLQ
ncbi:MAG TPA: hypothetical protein VNZ66_11945 [Aeromicrobium sp.]|nr:hypothetical protein [Aeromicrobium sp.]